MAATRRCRARRAAIRRVSQKHPEASAPPQGQTATAAEALAIRRQLSVLGVRNPATAARIRAVAVVQGRAYRRNNPVLAQGKRTAIADVPRVRNAMMAPAPANVVG